MGEVLQLRETGGKVRLCRMGLAHLFSSGILTCLIWLLTYALILSQWARLSPGIWMVYSEPGQSQAHRTGGSYSHHIGPIQIKPLLPWFPQEILEKWMDSSPANAIATSLYWLSVLPAAWAPRISPYSLNWAPQIMTSSQPNLELLPGYLDQLYGEVSFLDAPFSPCQHWLSSWSPRMPMTRSCLGKQQRLRIIKLLCLNWEYHMLWKISERES